MNARLPNKWRNGLTVRTGISAAFSKTGWLFLLCFYNLLDPAGWQGVALYMLNVGCREKEIQLEIDPGTLRILVRCSYYWATGPAAEASLNCNSQARVLSWFQLPGRLPIICKWRSPVEGVQTRLGYIGCTSTLFEHVMLTSCNLSLSVLQARPFTKCGLRDYTQSLAQLTFSQRIV